MNNGFCGLSHGFPSYDWMSFAPVSPISLNKALWRGWNPALAQAVDKQRQFIRVRTTAAKNLAGSAPPGLRVGRSQAGIAMKRTFAFAVVFVLAAFGPAHAAPL